MTSLGVARQQSPQTHLSSFTPPTIWTSGLTRRSAATSSQCSPGRDLGDGGSNSARGRCPCFPPLCAGRVDDVALRITATVRCHGESRRPRARHPSGIRIHGRWMLHRAQPLGWRRIGPPLIRRQSRNHWPNHGLLIQLGRADQHERACAAITSTLNSGPLPVRSRPWPLASCVSTDVCDLDWLVPVGTDDSPPRRDRPLAMREVAVPFLRYPSLKIFRSSLSVGPGHPPVTDVARNFVSCSPVQSESIHSRTLGLWRMLHLGTSERIRFGFDVSVAAIRSRPQSPPGGKGSR